MHWTNSLPLRSKKKKLTLHHARLVDLMQMAYSAEKAAAFAYQGHAGSVKRKEEKVAIKQIEEDEWHHRWQVLALMNQYEIKPKKWYELRFHIVGKIISGSCYVIGWFMPFYFAGRLESGNVCEYFRMIHFFHELGITEHDEMLYDMGMKEKDHEIYFYEQIKNHRLLPFFEKYFGWSISRSYNDVDNDNRMPVKDSDNYCRK